MSSAATMTPNGSAQTQPLNARNLTAPTTIEETGVPEEMLIQLLLRTLYTQGELTERSAGEIMKLPYGVMKELFTLIQREKLCEVKG
ncbi:MAG: hypothetical protein ABI618_18310, partial [Nitrospirota bacterium]